MNARRIPCKPLEILIYEYFRKMRNDSKGKLSDKKEALEYRNTTGRIAPEVVNRCASIKKLSFFPLLIIYLKNKTV